MRQTSAKAELLIRLGFGLLVAVGFAAIAVAADDASKPAPIRILSSAGIRATLEAVRADAERAIGRPIAVQYGGASGYKKQIEGGAPFDIAILTPEATADLIKEGFITAGTQATIGRTGIAVGSRGDGPKGDVSTPEALKKTFLSAKSIRYAGSGASRPTVDAMIAKLGIGDAIQGKTNLSLEPPAKLAKGETELVLYLTSEMMLDAAAGKIVFLGPLPEAVQGYAIMTAGIGAHAGDPAAAMALIQFLQRPALDPVLKSTGMKR